MIQMKRNENVKKFLRIGENYRYYCLHPIEKKSE